MDVIYFKSFLPDSLWFEVAIVSIIYALGNIIFGHFEERTPVWRRVIKYLSTILIIVLLSYYFSRIVAMMAIVIMILPVLYIHIILLPRKGINGLTGEPKSKYYDLRKWDKNIF